MKRCPTCNRAFAEPNLTFCTEDGTPLINVEASADASADDRDATIVSASASQDESGSESGASQGHATAPTDWKTPAYQPPGQFGTAPAAPERTAWPWVIGTLVVILLALLGLGIAAAIFVPDIMKARRARSENSSRDSNSNANSNSAVANENANANANANTTSAVNTLPPENQELVLVNLKNIEDEWTVANLNADKKKLAWILADDYVGMQDGVMQGKADYLRDIKPDTAVTHWDFRNLKLALNGNRATLTGIVRFANSEEDGEVLLNFTDKFVWRDGRWQAVASEVSPVK